MAVISTSGSETIAQWLTDFNSLSTVVGDAATLTTDVTTDLVAAINSLKTDVNSLEGSLDGLDFTPYLKNDSAFTKTAGNVTFNDNIALFFGTGQDLRLRHDGTNSYIDDIGTGSLIVRSSQILIRGSSTNENMIVATENGSAALYYNNVKKLETSATGFEVTGDVLVSGGVSSRLDDDLLALWGGTIGNGAGIKLFGGSHSTLANDINYDADQHNFRTQAGTSTFTIDASGNITATGGAIVGTSGSAATPAVRSNSDTNTGAYWDGADAFAISTGGSQAVRFDTRGTEFTGAIQEDVYTTNITGSTALTPANGTIWHVGLTGTVTFTDSLVNGDSMLLNIAGSTLYTVTWPASNWNWVGTGGSAPTLETSGKNVISLVKSGGVVYASYAGGTV